MPANLTPQYLEAEAKFKQAKTTEDKIKALEVMMAVIPKHKGTEKLRGQLKSRLAKLRQDLQRRPAIGRAEFIYNVRKEGAGQVALLGLPNVGKSALLSQITNANSEVADYPYTTQKPIPGMMVFENIQIQVVDAPPIYPDHIESGFSHLIRNANALILVLDLTEDPVFQTEVLLNELNQMKIRLVNKEQVPSSEEGMVFHRALLVGNKCDVDHALEAYRALEDQFEETFLMVSVSAKERINLDELKKRIYDVLQIVRVYTKAPGKEADFSEPVILKRGSTIEDVAFSIHKDFAAKLRYARIWGSGRYDGQMVKRDHLVGEGDVVELHL